MNTKITWLNVRKGMDDLLDMLYDDGMIPEENLEMYNTLRRTITKLDNVMSNQIPIVDVIKLKPCPYCQGESLKLEDLTDYAHGLFQEHAIICQNPKCECIGPTAKHEDNAVKAWNYRRYEYPRHTELDE